MDAIREEYSRLAREGLPPAELTNGKQQLKGQIMLSLESPGARMARLAGFVLYDDQYRPLDEMLREIDRVTPDDVSAIATDFFAPERQTVVRLGPEKAQAVSGRQ
jgi:predicted Zn-dependent peptidase